MFYIGLLYLKVWTFYRRAEPASDIWPCETYPLRVFLGDIYDIWLPMCRSLCGVVSRV